MLILLASLSSAADLMHQGRLLDELGEGLNGTYTVQVSFYGPPNGDAFRGTVGVPDVPVVDGYYAVRLQNVNDAWIQGDSWISVGTLTTGPLGPKQHLASVPSAVYSERTGGIQVSSTAVTGPCSDAGAVRYDTTVSAIVVCDGLSWTPVASQPTDLVIVDGHREWADGTFATSCRAYLSAQAPYAYSGQTGSGTYRIDPDGPGNTVPFDVECEQTELDGGWTRFLTIVSSETYDGITGLPNSTELVTNNTWSFSRRLLQDSGREVLIRETVPPYRTHRYRFDDASVSDETFIGMLTGDADGAFSAYNWTTASWDTFPSGTCNANNHSQWNCSPAGGVRFHYATRDWRNDGGSDYTNWSFTGYQNCCSTNYGAYVRDWNGAFNTSPHELFVR